MSSPVLLQLTTPTLPVLFQVVPDGGRRFWEFFTVNIRNPHTRRAYFKAVETFAAWLAERERHDLASVTPIHAAAYIEQHVRPRSKPTVKQHLAAIRMLFDWLVTGQVMPANPAHAVRGPRHSVKKGKTSVLDASEMRDLLVSIDTSSLIGLRDRALIALMGYTFARVSAAVGMKVGDFYVQNRRRWVQLHEKGGKVTELPCHHMWISISKNGSRPPGWPGSRMPRSPLPCATASCRIHTRRCRRQMST